MFFFYSCDFSILFAYILHACLLLSQLKQKYGNSLIIDEVDICLSIRNVAYSLR